jgi:NRAMP (natural resistance-associated macrophage protein)-like metal ion transporter
MSASARPPRIAERRFAMTSAATSAITGAMTTETETVFVELDVSAPAAAAVLEDAPPGRIHGAFGTIHLSDFAPSASWRARLKTMMAVIGPGLIVMVGDNDAGAFGAYTQAGQNYGTALLWTLLLLVPALYVNQEMVLRLGAVSGVGHARLIIARFGKLWGAFSVIDLLLLNGLTIVTEFIGVSLALDYLGLPKAVGVAAAAVLIMAAASTGDFRKFERFAMTLVAGSLLLIPVVLMVHPPIEQVAHDMVTPQIPQGAKVNEVMLLVVAIIGTTIAPWQLFFQQSYIADKGITARFIRYERADLWLGIVIVIVGAAAMMAFCAAVFEGRPEFGAFTDPAGIAHGLEKYEGRLPAALFAIALLDASVIGAAAVSLASAYAVGDLFSVGHSLKRKPGEAKGFYLIYCALIIGAAALVMTPGTPLGLISNAVQTLSGVLLPSATVFLLLLCNDKAVLGPWVNTRLMNVFTGGVVAALVAISVILTASALWPGMGAGVIAGMLVAGGAATVAAAAAGAGLGRGEEAPEPAAMALRDLWRTPPLGQLSPAGVSRVSRLMMIALRAYVVVAGGLVLARIVQLGIYGAA